MSTIVVVKKAEQIAIGADTLTKFDYIKESADYVLTPSKIIKAGENFLAHVGHASWGLILEHYFSTFDAIPPLHSRMEIFEFASHFHRSLKEEYYLNPNSERENPFETSRLYCLIANPYGIFGVYSLRSVQEYSRFAAFGSGADFALGAMHTIYNQFYTAAEIAQIGLRAAAMFDDSTAEPLEIYELAANSPLD